MTAPLREVVPCPRCGGSCLPSAGCVRDRPALEFIGIADLIAQVQAEGPRRYLLRGLWPGGTYGMLAGDAKAQKTWTTADLAISVASGTPFLGAVEVDTSGPVLMLCGEGGKAPIVRRLTALAEARGVELEELPISVCPRAPNLGDAGHLKLLEEQLQVLPPVLVTLDPLYRAVPGGDGSNLYKMGDFLARAEVLTSAAGASLWVAHHQNRGEGRGLSRVSGAGPGEWGRVVASATVIARHKVAETGGSDVLTELDWIGEEIAGGTIRVRRRIWQDDRDDPNSPLHVETTAEDVEGPGMAGGSRPPAQQKILEALGEGEAEIKVIGDRIAARHGHGLKRATISKQLNELRREALVEEGDDGPFQRKTWRLRAES